MEEVKGEAWVGGGEWRVVRRSKKEGENVLLLHIVE